VSVEDLSVLNGYFADAQKLPQFGQVIELKQQVDANIGQMTETDTVKMRDGIVAKGYAEYGNLGQGGLDALDRQVVQLQGLLAEAISELDVKIAERDLAAERLIDLSGM